MTAPIIEIGKTNRLKVLKSTPQGLYVGDDVEEILLPNKYIPEGTEMGDTLDVFIYIDSEDRLIATNLEPYAQRDEFAYLTVKAVTSVGAFMDWGLEKDLLVPFKEQLDKMYEGQGYLVYVYLDDVTDRLVATSHINRFLELEEIPFTEGDEVEILMGGEGERGFTAIINNKYRGLVYKNQVFKNVRPGDRTKAYIKQVREDLKIDLELEKSGIEKIDPLSQRLLQTLKEKEGFLKLHDKSDPEDIKNQLQMSKKNFKKAVGTLFKQRIIVIENDGIRMI